MTRFLRSLSLFFALGLLSQTVSAQAWNLDLLHDIERDSVRFIVTACNPGAGAYQFGPSDFLVQLDPTKFDVGPAITPALIKNPGRWSNAQNPVEYNNPTLNWVSAQNSVKFTVIPDPSAPSGAPTVTLNSCAGPHDTVVVFKVRYLTNNAGVCGTIDTVNFRLNVGAITDIVNFNFPLPPTLTSIKPFVDTAGSTQPVYLCPLGSPLVLDTVLTSSACQNTPFDFKLDQDLLFDPFVTHTSDSALVPGAFATMTTPLSVLPVDSSFTEVFPNVGQYAVRVISNYNDGANCNCNDTTDTDTITVAPSPTPYVNIPDTLRLCGNVVLGTDTLGITNNPGNGPGTTYLWTNNIPPVNGSAFTIEAPADSATRFSVTRPFNLTDTLGFELVATFGACSDSDSVLVVVLETPTPFFASLAGVNFGDLDTTICKDILFDVNVQDSSPYAPVVYNVIPPLQVGGIGAATFTPYTDVDAVLDSLQLSATDSVIFRVYLQDANNCLDSTDYNLDIHPNVRVFADFTETYCSAPFAYVFSITDVQIEGVSTALGLFNYTYTPVINAGGVATVFGGSDNAPSDTVGVNGSPIAGEVDSVIVSVEDANGCFVDSTIQMTFNNTDLRLVSVNFLLQGPTDPGTATPPYTMIRDIEAGLPGAFDVFKAGGVGDPVTNITGAARMTPGFDPPALARDVFRVEVRDPASAFALVSSGYGWLLQNASIVDFETGVVPNVQICDAAISPVVPYNITIVTRNHLPYMSQNTVIITNGAPTNIDFRDPAQVFDDGTGFSDPLTDTQIGITPGGDPDRFFAVGNVYNDVPGFDVNAINAVDFFFTLFEATVSPPLGLLLHDTDFDADVDAADYTVVQANSDQLYYSFLPY